MPAGSSVLEKRHHPQRHKPAFNSAKKKGPSRSASAAEGKAAKGWIMETFGVDWRLNPFNA
jgi:hypothetical protein